MTGSHFCQYVRFHKSHAANSNRQKSEPKPASSERKAREGTKQALVIEMLRRTDGASIAEIVEATGWLSHTARGVLAGSLKKKLGLAIESEKEETRGRVYRITISE